jgi:hypothetical protein
MTTFARKSLQATKLISKSGNRIEVVYFAQFPNVPPAMSKTDQIVFSTDAMLRTVAMRSFASRTSRC